jgi:hypothetical protein
MIAIMDVEMAKHILKEFDCQYSSGVVDNAYQHIFFDKDNINLHICFSMMDETEIEVGYSIEDHVPTERCDGYYNLLQKITDQFMKHIERDNKWRLRFLTGEVKWT